MSHPALFPAVNLALRAALSATLGLALSCGGTASTEKQPITFSVTVPADTPADATVWISGNLTELGAFNGAGVALTKGADGKHTATVSLAAGAALEFKFTLGSSSTLEVAADGSDIRNRTYTVTAAARLDFTVARFAHPYVCQPTLTGNIKKHLQVSPGTIAVKARDLIVYLPPGYDANTSVRYPVLYL